MGADYAYNSALGVPMLNLCYTVLHKNASGGIALHRLSSHCNN
jgi:hypothetical protein